MNIEYTYNEEKNLLEFKKDGMNLGFILDGKLKLIAETDTVDTTDALTEWKHIIRHGHLREPFSFGPTEQLGNWPSRGVYWHGREKGCISPADRQGPWHFYGSAGLDGLNYLQLEMLAEKMRLLPLPDASEFPAEEEEV